jgi:uncharacterized heparinase superfamily protein
MRILEILERESPLLVSREVLWRLRRGWRKRLILGRIENPDSLEFRRIPYYTPDLQFLSQDSRAVIVAFADEIRAGRYPFLGYRTADLGTRPNWNRDFISGTEWSKVRGECRDFIRHDGSDIKVPYELSRLQFLPVLAKAHLLTADDSYRQVAKDLLSDWIQSNPAPVGVNWTIAMEAALRGMSICFLLNLLSPFRRDDQPWLATVTRSLAQHLLYIEANIEFSHLLASNHYLSDIVGLYCLSLFLDGQGMAARRREYRRRIETEMARQVYEDGGDYEASSGYQVLVTQLFATAFLLMRCESSVPVSPAFVKRLRAMFQFLDTLASPSGELPHVGDCDDGRTELLFDDLQQMTRLPATERNSLTISRLLGLGHRLFRAGTGPGDDAAWYGLTDPAHAPYFEAQLAPDSAGPVKVLPNSGIGVLKHGSAELLFFAIPNGIFGKGSHTHNDKLSFVLRIRGKEILCDPGTCCYTKDIVTRNRFRSTAAHNTLKMDGTEQNRIDTSPLAAFILGNEASVSPMQEGREAGACFLRASHGGYRGLGVTHTRTVRAVDGEFSFVIEDDLDGEGVHNFELNFQLARNRTVEVAAVGDKILCRIFGDPQIQLAINGPAGLHGAVQPSLISSAYGVTVPAMQLRIWGRAAVPARITTYISWSDLNSITKDQTESAEEEKMGRAVVQEVGPA